MGSKTNNMGTHKINEVANMERKSPLMLLWNLTTFWSVPITACGALARGKQGYKKVVFPLITPPWGRLWSVLHWKSCWSVVKCQSTWKHCFTPCEGSSWRHWQRALSSSYPDLVLLSPPGVDICSLFFFSLPSIHSSNWNEHPDSLGLLHLPNSHPQVFLWVRHYESVYFIP